MIRPPGRISEHTVSPGLFSCRFDVLNADYDRLKSNPMNNDLDIYSQINQLARENIELKNLVMSKQSK